MKRRIIYYRLPSGKDLIAEFLEKLENGAKNKVAWTLKLIQDNPVVPTTYFKKLKNTKGIWEVRVQYGGNIYRILGFYYKLSFIVLNHAFTKKTEKTPQKEIKTAQTRREDFYEQIR